MAGAVHCDQNLLKDVFGDFRISDPATDVYPQQNGRFFKKRRISFPIPLLRRSQEYRQLPISI